MKASKLTFIAAIALGSVLTLGTALAADTNAPSSTPSAGNPPAGGPGGMRGRGPNMEQLTKDLDLKDDQKDKVKTALDEMRQKNMDLRNDTSLSQEDRQAKRKAIMDATDAKMKEILTSEQYAKWEKSPMHRMGGQRGQRNGGNAPGGNPPAGNPPAGNPPQN